MTVSTSTSTTTILGNNSTTLFSFSFIGVIPSDISVIYTDANGSQTTLSPSQYTLTLNPPATGSLWGTGGTVLYPKSGSPITNGTSLTIVRTVPLTQLTTISNQGDFYPQVVEQALDTLCFEIQQVAARTGFFSGTWASGVTYHYSDIVVDGANGANTQNYYLCTQNNIGGVWSTDLAAGLWVLIFNVQAVAGYATSAASSAVAAATSASLAATSASSAGTFATTASNAATSATASATTASNAATSATASASTASTAATTASSAATTASTAATTASTAATNAAASATSASTSATNAAASAVAAGSTLVATSTTSNTIGTGNFTFTTQANKNFFPGQIVIAASSANGANYIHGFVASYSGTTLIITETDIGGSGTIASWNISASGPAGPSGGGTGTVTAMSVATANGFSGTVASPTTTPIVTLMATPTGVLKSNGTALSAATAGTDYSAGTSALTTGILKSTTSTGALTIAVAGDFPTLNQNTSGNAATVTTINGRLAAGTNTSLTGSGTSGSPYVVDIATATNSVLGVVKPDGTTISVTGGVLSVIGAAVANVYQSTPPNPTGTTSASPIMMGLAGTITPTSTGKVMLVISGDVGDSGLAGIITVQASYGAGGAPSNGAAQTGTQVGGKIQIQPFSGGALIPFSCNSIISGLAVGTTYWLDLAVSISTGNTATLRDISISAYEIK